LTFEEKLARYAELLVRVGVNVQPGQRLVVNAPIDSAPLVRLVARKAYEAGCSLVDVHYGDEQLTRIRYESAPRDSFEEFADWTVQAGLNEMERGSGFLSIAGSDPELLRDADPELVATVARVAAERTRPLSQRMMAFDVNWCGAAMPVPSWARRVFPDEPVEDAVRRLWDAIFTATRVAAEDPVAAWKAHLANLQRRKDHLNERRFAAVHFRGPGTDLTVGLADGHVWIGGGMRSKRGVLGVPNLPTDEVFTAPHRERVNGTVRATKPLSVRGALIEGIEMRFEGGRVVEARASRGQDTLERLLGTDEGAQRLGEVALVPASAPVAQTGVLFYNTLFDENAASHVALGRGYAFTVQNPASRAEAGLNDSLVHVDWMIGSPEVNVDGVRADGAREPLMRRGEWVF